MDGAVAADHWLDVTAELLQRPLTRFPHELVQRELRATFEVRTVSWNWADGSTLGFHLDPPVGGWGPGLVPLEHRFAYYRHPLIQWFGATGDPRPQTVGRVPAQISPDRDKAAIAELLAPVGTEQQLSVPYVLQPGTHRAFVLARSVDDFTDSDLVLAGRLQRLFQAVHAQVRVLGAMSMVSVEELRRAGLTGREAAVLALAAQGLTTTAIAHRLGMAPGTARKHLEHIYRKLGVSGRVEAVQVAAMLAAEGIALEAEAPLPAP
ncbi:helix-turn-helix transcriptional regulator [Ornithinicoccus halotolerans]|uniref:helix-turn-helix transcriptional regulator n=1 Tax=Ornithinicoccus halotolerans TaxID=1748220 RepID=UPI00129687F7|nr:helix-turn-helix transcriptional regulator [Ornithinicoccus halotolerans]